MQQFLPSTLRLTPCTYAATSGRYTYHPPPIPSCSYNASMTIGVLTIILYACSLQTGLPVPAQVQFLRALVTGSLSTPVGCWRHLSDFYCGSKTPGFYNALLLSKHSTLLPPYHGVPATPLRMVDAVSFLWHFFYRRPCSR